VERLTRRSNYCCYQILIRSYQHIGTTCNQPVELTKDWRSDCLEKQNLLVVEICGVLGRCTQFEGLAQSNNNAKMNNSAKHDQTLLVTSETE
jgi:hypothetical protein